MLHPEQSQKVQDMKDDIENSFKKPDDCDVYCGDACEIGVCVRQEIERSKSQLEQKDKEYIELLDTSDEAYIGLQSQLSQVEKERDALYKLCKAYEGSNPNHELSRQTKRITELQSQLKQWTEATGYDTLEEYLDP